MKNKVRNLLLATLLFLFIAIPASATAPFKTDSIQVGSLTVTGSCTGCPGSSFAMSPDWVSATDSPFYAAGTIATTTISGTCTAPATSCTLTSAASFANNQYAILNGAGTAGANLLVKISNIVTNTITFAPATATTVTGTNVYHDDSNALALAIATQKNIYIPCGYFNVTTGFSPSGTNTSQIISGCAPFSLWVRNHVTSLNYRNTTGWVFTYANVYESKLQNINIHQDSSFTPVSGGAILCTTVCSENIFEGIDTRNTYIGIKIDSTAGNSYWSTINVVGALLYGLWIDGTQGYGNNQFVHSAFSGNGSGTECVHVTNADVLRIVSSVMATCDVGIHLTEASGQRIDDVTLSDIHFDNIYVSAIVADAVDACATTHGIHSAKFVNVNVAPRGGGTSGPIVSVGANVCNIGVSNSNLWGYSTTSIFSDGGVGTIIDGNSFTTLGAGNDTNAILLTSSSVGAIIVGNSVVGSSTFTNGLNCVAGASYPNVGMNNFRGAATGINATCAGLTGWNTNSALTNN